MWYPIHTREGLCITLYMIECHVNCYNIWSQEYYNNDCFYGILCYDEYREFTGITGDIRFFLFVIVKWFLGVWFFNGIKYLFY